ncbi:hypothetical protein HK104_007470 [Borealophlyctis nickersoniae]|nr:hypothetical protein HK104_007470 [Borealophlyctis nickersoniae]
MLISHQSGRPEGGDPPIFHGYYPQPHVHHPPRLSNPTPYHTQQMRKQSNPHQPNTIDPSLLSVGGGGHHYPPVKQEEPLDPTDPFIISGEYDLTGPQNGHGNIDPTAMTSPLSSSPLDDFEAAHDEYSARGSGSLHNSPYGTPGMHMPGNYYSMSMPVHSTSGFGSMEQAKLMGSQPSSFGAYGSGMSMPDIMDEEGKSHIDLLNEKRRRRRESHNAVERRRRDNINEKIQELATLLPDFQTDTQTKPNKGVILRRSVEYVRQIQGFATRQVDRNQELEDALRRLLAQTGFDESMLGLSVPLGTPVEMPSAGASSATAGEMQQQQGEQNDQDMY